MRTLVSKKLSGICLLPVELEIGRKSPSEGAQPLQQFRASRLARDGKFPCVGDMDLDLIAFLEPQRRDRGGRKAHGQAIAPFGDPHMVPHGYTLTNMYIPTGRRSRRARPMSGPSPAQVRPKSRSWSFDFGRRKNRRSGTVAARIAACRRRMPALEGVSTRAKDLD